MKYKIMIFVRISIREPEAFTRVEVHYNYCVKYYNTSSPWNQNNSCNNFKTAEKNKPWIISRKIWSAVQNNGYEIMNMKHDLDTKARQPRPK